MNRSKVREAAAYLEIQRVKPYPELLEEIQRATNDSLWQLFQGGSEEEIREKTLAFIVKELEKQKSLNYDTRTELAIRLYNDMRRYSVLTDVLDHPEEVEGVNINSWQDIRVKYRDGRSEKARPFNSPEHAKDIFNTRLFLPSGVTFDEAIPMGEASIGDSIRITAVCSPIVSKEVGVAGYIRMLGNKIYTAEEYVERDFAAERELLLLRLALRRGNSILVVGKVNTGKTTLVKHLLHEMEDDLQIITVESGAREMDLVKKDANGQTVNNVVHLLTKDSENERNRVNQEDLVVKMLRLNPDIASIAEMRDIEAYAAQEASTSGNVLISTAHAGGARQGHKRVAGLCRKKYHTDYQEAIENAIEAFPIVVFIHNLEDGRRRIMNISDCYVGNEGELVYRPIWEYQIERNIHHPDGHIEIVGTHRQVNSPSERMVERMRLYGVTTEELSLMQKEGD